MGKWFVKMVKKDYVYLGSIDKLKKMVNNEEIITSEGAQKGEITPQEAPQLVKKPNPILTYLRNFKDIKKNWGKVRASPYASLNLSIKFRQIIVYPLIAWLVYMTYSMIRSYTQTGMMGTITKFATIGIMGYICYAIYKTIPAAKRQLEYYKRNPHLVNYCPTDAKTTIDEILNNIKINKEKEINKTKQSKTEGGGK